MKKENAKKAGTILLLATLIVGVMLLSGCDKKSSDDSADSAKKTDAPYLKMEFSEFPKVINNVCEPISFKVKVKNTGTASLSYEDVEKDDYYFEMSTFMPESGNKRQFTTTNKNDISDPRDEILLEDFSTINPGEEKILVFNSPMTTDDWVYTNGNAFSLLSDDFKDQEVQFLLRVLKELGEVDRVISNEPTTGSVDLDIWRAYKGFEGEIEIMGEICGESSTYIPYGW